MCFTGIAGRQQHLMYSRPVFKDEILHYVQTERLCCENDSLMSILTHPHLILVIVTDDEMISIC